MSTRRLSLISSHINSFFPPLPHDNSLDEYRVGSSKLDKDLAKRLYFGAGSSLLDEIREHLATVPVCSHSLDYSTPKNVLRKLQMDRIAATYFLVKSDYERDQVDPKRKLLTPYVYAEFDQSTVTISLVQINLYLDSLQELGTAKHRNLIDKGYSYENIGCFAITELGHGSDVSKLETNATYDHTDRTFVLHSPKATAAKWWIGALAKNANTAIVFANLIVDGHQKGVHVFHVTIRDQNHDVCPGLTIGDCGEKAELNGIDNGFILFNNYKVPYDSLLDRYAAVKEDGKYVSTIKNKDKRLAVQLASLVRGRICIIFGSEANLRAGLTIALRFAAVRRQFSSPDGKEMRLIEYPHHQYRVIPHISKMMATEMIADTLLSKFNKLRETIRMNPDDPFVGEYHAILSASKALGSWYAINGLQALRESTGGHGYSSHAHLGRIRDSQDVHATWEGDNTILLQQTGKFLLKVFQKLFQGQQTTLPGLKFLNVRDNPKPDLPNKEALQDFDLLLKLLEYRVNYMMQTTAMKLQENSGKADTVLEAWNMTQSFYSQEMSKAFGELSIARAFRDRLPEGNSFTENAFKDYFRLYVLCVVSENLELYLDDYLSAEQARMVKDSVMELCGQLAPVSVGLFDAIGVHDNLHGSSLGQSHGQVYAEIIRRVEADPTCYQKANWVQTLHRLRETGNAIRTNNK